MSDLDFTTVVATDKNYIPHLKTAWRSWVFNRPEILLHPMMVLLDSRDVDQIPSLEAALNHPDLSVIDVGDLPGADQREKMLTAIVKCPPLIKTKWMLKLDCDVLARAYDPKWCSDELAAICCGQTKPPLFMAPPWGYTKPANAIQILDDWADSQKIAGKRLDLKGEKDTVRTPGRIISYVFFGQTIWLQHISSLFAQRMPLPSQDTYHWYMAKRTGQEFRHLNALSVGWQHIRGAKMEQELKSIDLKLPVKVKEHRASFPKLLESLGKKNLVGVEVGVDRGELSQCLLDAFPQMIIHLVDQWDFHGQESDYYKSGDHRSRYSQDRYRKNMIDAIRHTAHVWPRVRLWKMPSVEAAAKFPDNSMDFVFIDADHTYDAVLADINAWWPKVAKGGMLSGHDAFHRREKSNKGFAVGKAATEFSKSLGKDLELRADTVWVIRK